MLLAESIITSERLIVAGASLIAAAVPAIVAVYKFRGKRVEADVQHAQLGVQADVLKVDTAERLWERINKLETEHAAVYQQLHAEMEKNLKLLKRVNEAESKIHMLQKELQAIKHDIND